MKKFILLMGIIIGLSYGSIGINVQAAHAEEYGIIRKQTRLYQGPGKEAADMGEIGKGERVDIISILQDYVIVRYQNQYAYVLKQDIGIDKEYETYLGKTQVCNSPYDFILTNGNIYETSLQKLLDAYQEIPRPIRERFEREGFLIIMTEEDISKLAYAPYGGYRGIGQVKSVFDYERKLLFVNDEWPTSIIHEIGHYVNDTLSGFSSSPENLCLFESEALKISQYGMGNDREYFAEAFRMYVTDPQLLILISKPSYELVNQAVNKMT